MNAQALDGAPSPAPALPIEGITSILLLIVLMGLGFAAISEQPIQSSHRHDEKHHLFILAHSYLGGPDLLE